nr:hypothetical protein BaRGS_013411 [Batillaria attramentaria]
MAYYEICKLLTENSDSVTTGRLSNTKAPYVVDGSRWTGYDDAMSIQEKVDYVMEHGLGGVAVFSIDMDDFNGLCGGESNPLLHTIQRQFSGLVVIALTGNYRTMTSSPDTIQQFVTGAIKLLHSYRFDGLVIDWEFPTTRDDPPEDKHRFTQLLQATYEAFANDASETGRPRLLLVATISPNPWQVSHSYELPDISNYVDWLDVKAFGLHGTWEQTSGHHSSLYTPSEDDTDSIHYMVQKIISASVPANKMTLGIAFYGISENMTDSTDLGSPIAGASLPRIALRWTPDGRRKRGRPKETEEDRGEREMKEQGWTWNFLERCAAEYVKQQGLSGVSLWTIDLDDFNGMYLRLTALKREKPNLKVMLAVGGWNLGSAEFR